MDSQKEEFVGILQGNRKTMTVKQEGKKFQQYVCAMIASIGALVIGNVLAWTSPSFTFLQSSNYSAPFIITEDEKNWIAAFTPIGAIFGALPAGMIANALGRKVTLILFTIPWIGTWIMTTLSPNVIVLYIARLLSGVIVGLFCAVLPMYVSEIAENSVRGTLGTLFQLFITLGILMDYVLGIFNSYLILCNVITAISVLFLVALFFIPESPTYLVKKNRKVDAEQCLRRLRGPHYDIQTELSKLRTSLESSTQHSFSFSILMKRSNALALTITIGLMLCQQLSGVNGVIFFATDIFKAAQAKDAAFNTIIVGVVQTAATVVSSILVDRAGRKILLMVSSVGMAIAHLALGYFFFLTSDPNTNASDIGWLPLVSLVFFIIVFSLGMGPIPWMMAGEVLDPEVSGFGSGVSVAVNWGCVSLVTFFFGPVSNLIGKATTFWMFSGICVIAAVFVLLVVPETKGKSMQQVQNELAGKNSVNLNGSV